MIIFLTIYYTFYVVDLRARSYPLLLGTTYHAAHELEYRTLIIRSNSQLTYWNYFCGCLTHYLSIILPVEPTADGFDKNLK